MRVHLRNVVFSALKQGVILGQHRVGKLSKQKQKDLNIVVDTMMHSIGESLDHIIDFRDDPEHGEDDDKPRNIGFHSTEAVGHKSSAPHEDMDEEDRAARLRLLN